MDGIELAARFSYITNSLRFCGPREASHQFLKYISNKKNPKGVQESLKRFEGLYPYLSAIAEKFGKGFSDFDVVEAYWIGNKLLEKFNEDDLKDIIRNLMLRGLPKSFGMNLIRNLPQGLVPHHNFNVFYVGVGKTTGSVETTLQNMENCMVSYGKVVQVLGDKLIVAAQALREENKQIRLVDGVAKTAVFLPEMIGPVRNGDIVALHWGFAPMVLNDFQVSNLIKFSTLTLKSVNKQRSIT